METYWSLALMDLEEAQFLHQQKRWRTSIFFYQQFVEKGAKSLLEKVDSEHILLKRTHNPQLVLGAIDNSYSYNEIGEKSAYFNKFYINSRYPGDTYVEVVEEAVNRGLEIALELKIFFEEQHSLLKSYEDELKDSLSFHNIKNKAKE